MKFITSIVLMIVFAAAGRFAYHKFFAVDDNEQLPAGVEVGSREHLRLVAADINAKLPRDIDRDTRLIRVVPRERQLIYRLMYMRYSSKEIDSGKFLEAATPFVKKQVCGEKRMKAFWKNGITATYEFAGNDDYGIGTVSVSAADCGF